MVIRKSKLLNIRNSSTASDVARALGSFYNHKTFSNRIDFDTLIERKIHDAHTKNARAAAKAPKKPITAKPAIVKPKKTVRPPSPPTGIQGFESSGEPGWKTAIRIKDALERMSGKSGTLDAVGKEIYAMDGLPYPTGDKRHVTSINNRIISAIGSQGRHMGIALMGNHVRME